MGKGVAFHHPSVCGDDDYSNSGEMSITTISFRSKVSRTRAVISIGGGVAGCSKDNERIKRA